MGVSEVVDALRRQWLVVIIGLLATVGLTFSAYVLSKPVYEITGTILFMPPASSVGTSPGQNDNPYLQLGGLGQAVDLLCVYLSDQSTQTEIKTISPDASFTVQRDSATSSPLLVVQVSDSTPEIAVTIRDLLMTRTPVRLQQMQADLGVATRDQITSIVVTRDARAEEVGKNRLRVAVVAGFLGAGLTLVATARLDARRLRLSRPVPRRTNREPNLPLDTQGDYTFALRANNVVEGQLDIDHPTTENSTSHGGAPLRGQARKRIEERTHEPDSATS